MFLWPHCGKFTTATKDAARLTPAALPPHSGSGIRGVGTGQFIREGIMDTDRLWDLQVNWTRFFDAGLLVTGFISMASVALQLI